MIDENRIKKTLLDMRDHCQKSDLCKNCSYKRICYENLPFLWNDEEIENMAAGWYELLRKEEEESNEN